MSEIELWRSCPSVRSATLTIVVSRIDMIIPRITTPAIRQTWASIRSDASGLKAESVADGEDISYRKLRYQSFIFQGICARSHTAVRTPGAPAGAHGATRPP